VLTDCLVRTLGGGGGGGQCSGVGSQRTVTSRQVSSALKMEAIRSSETSVYNKPTWRQKTALFTLGLLPPGDTGRPIPRLRIAQISLRRFGLIRKLLRYNY
jgi:hypothetical protein